MPAYVVDASAALSFLTVSQQTDAARRHFAAQVDPYFVPDIFHAEIRHALLRLERKQVITPASCDQALEDLKLWLAPAVATDEVATASAFMLARGAGLGFFDAVYLQLALNASANLVTRDRALIGAAQAAGVAVIDLR
jgi:predicted nucleic acid-binding protein